LSKLDILPIKHVGFFPLLDGYWMVTTKIFLSGWWYTYPSEKYESQWEGLSHIMKNKKCLKPPTSYKIGWLGFKQ
jgi:hypothetical protein